MYAEPFTGRRMPAGDPDDEEEHVRGDEVPQVLRRCEPLGEVPDYEESQQSERDPAQQAGVSLRDRLIGSPSTGATSVLAIANPASANSGATQRPAAMNAKDRFIGLSCSAADVPVQLRAAKPSD